jgi:hypothetical protein
VASDHAGHDHWHTYEHLHERLSIPGFIRGTRWIRQGEGPRYLMLYEVEDVAMKDSPDYLAPLNDPTAWTSSTMLRLRGMVRGFCHVKASAGYGLGHAAFALRYTAADAAAARAWLTRKAKSLVSQPGIASAVVLDPVEAPQMTREQALRGKDATLAPMIFVTGYLWGPFRAACEQEFSGPLLQLNGMEALDAGFYELAFTATAAEVARTPKPPPRSPP